MRFAETGTYEPSSRARNRTDGADAAARNRARERDTRKASEVGILSHPHVHASRQEALPGQAVAGRRFRKTNFGIGCGWTVVPWWYGISSRLVIDASSSSNSQSCTSCATIVSSSKFAILLPGHIRAPAEKGARNSGWSMTSAAVPFLRGGGQEAADRRARRR
uniref:Uncharacterized protein n=1 Tax=Emiliania huxleyi TaxID=2903 RepID=A0A7S3WQS8_EMIHU